MNGEEALAYWSAFHEATGIKRDFLRLSGSTSGRVSRSSTVPATGHGSWSPTNLAPHSQPRHYKFVLVATNLERNSPPRSYLRAQRRTTTRVRLGSSACE